MATTARDHLDSYRRKRDFTRTGEPSGAEARGRANETTKGLAFVVQKHDATRLHYDFRIEWGGVLKSWAVTRGPSLDSREKRLAVRTEDHPLDYGDFEGTIPEGEYGGGTVMLWDRGTWEPEDDVEAGLEGGTLKMRLHGAKMDGRWVLVRMKPRGREKRENWLLIKERDAKASATQDLLASDRSVKTGRAMEAIAAGDEHLQAELSEQGKIERSIPAQARTGQASPASRSAHHNADGSKTEPSSTKGDHRMVAGIRLSHPDRVVFAEQGVTKLDLAEYYEAVAPRMLRHAGERALSLIRCPQGKAKACFFQQHGAKGFPDAVRRVPIAEKGGRTFEHLYVEDAAGLVAAVQMNVLEFHIWGSRVDALEKPDRLVFDLDPDSSVAFAKVVEAAAEFRETLRRLGLESLPMVTGGKGVHVVVPLARRQGWDEVSTFAKAFAEEVARDAPDRFVATMAKAKRRGRIFIDWLRNERGQTAIAPYSTRSREGAPVAVPVSWAELAELDGGNRFAPRDVRKRLDHADPWSDYDGFEQSITKKMLAKVDTA